MGARVTDHNRMTSFEHERLDAYRLAIELLAVAEQLARSLPQGRSYLADQLRRASLSISLNIAEGAGEFAPADKARFYRMARRSATECAAIVDAGRTLELIEPLAGESARALLHRLVAVLTALIVTRRESRSGTDLRSGHHPSGGARALASGQGSGRKRIRDSP